MSDWTWVRLTKRIPLPVAMFACIHMARWHRDVIPNRDAAIAWEARAFGLVMAELLSPPRDTDA